MGEEGVLCKLLGDSAPALYSSPFTDIYEESPEYSHEVHTVMPTEFGILNSNNCVL